MDAEFAYLTTVGRRTGQPHVIEIWYAEEDGAYYVMSGGRDSADWVRNIKANPAVTIRIGGPRSFPGPEGRPALAHVVASGRLDARARRLLAAKYQGWTEGAELSRGARSALVVAISPLAQDPVDNGLAG